MIRLSLIWVLMLAVTLSVGCRPVFNTKDQLVRYLNDPNAQFLQQKSLENGLNISMSYVPHQLLPRSRQDCLYFLLRLSKNDKEVLRQTDMETYSRLMQLLAFRFNEYLIVKSDGGKLIPVSDCLFQPTFGLNSANEVVIVLKNDNLGSVKAIELFVHEFGLGTGNVQFKYLTRDIKDLNNRIAF